eukprot:13407-Heterococcus_DN1.PRE.1
MAVMSIDAFYSSKQLTAEAIVKAFTLALMRAMNSLRSSGRPVRAPCSTTAQLKLTISGGRTNEWDEAQFTSTALLYKLSSFIWQQIHYNESIMAISFCCTGTAQRMPNVSTTAR